MSIDERESEDILKGISTPVLRAFARVRKIHSDDNTPRSKLISLIIEDTQSDNENLYRHITSIELEGNQEQFKENICELIDVKTHHATSMVNSTRWSIYFIIGTIFSIVGLGGYTLRDIMSSHTELTEQLNAQKALVDANRGLLINEIASDIAETLDAFSISLPDAEVIDNVNLRLSAVKTILDAYPNSDGYTESEHYRMLLLLSDAMNGLIVLDNLKDSATTTTDDYNNVAEYWAAIEVNVDFVTDRFRIFANNFVSQKSNILGTIELKRYRHSQRRPSSILNNAEKYFYEALANRAIFARPHLNLSTVEYHRYEGLKRANAPEIEQVAMFDSAIQHIDTAMEFMSNDSDDRGVVINNRANLELYFADSIKDSNPTEAEKIATDIISLLTEAWEKRETSPVSLVTRSEAEGLLLYISSAKLGEWESTKKETELSRILNLIEEARQSGFTGLDDFTRDSLLENLPLLKHLQFLDEEYLPRLFSAAGIN